MQFFEEIKSRSEKKTIQPKEWLGKEIKPLTASDVHTLMTDMYHTVLELSRSSYTTTRGVSYLLDKDREDYAKLPDHGGKTALEIIESLPPRASWLDLGCGSGTFIEELLLDVRPDIQAVGFDARTWKIEADQEDYPEIPKLILGNIDTVKPSDFPGHENGFDLITSAAVFYHLPDFWGALLRSSRLLKNKGKIIISTINRPTIAFGRPIENSAGEFSDNPLDCNVTYYRNRNIFDIDGNLIPLGEATRRVNSSNPGFSLEYHPGPMKDAVQGSLSFGGGFSGERTGDANLNLSCIFYCFYPDSKNRHRKKEIEETDISFIVAKSKEEIEALHAQGYVSVQDRYDQENPR